MKRTDLVICILLFVAALAYYIRPVIQNTPSFMTDEMYWISSSKTVHMLLAGDLKNPLWEEYYGFTNLNGAKYLYGFGLLLLGHTDVSRVGVAPETYYRWTSFEPGPFPASHALYPLLRDARIISAIFLSGAVAFMYMLSKSIRLTRPGGITAAILFGMHPASFFVATHAFADSMLLFFQILLLTALFAVLRKPRFTSGWQIAIGVLYACIVSVKLNALMFAFPILLVCVVTALRDNHTSSPKSAALTLLLSLLRISAAALVTLIVLQPNVIFFPSYTPLDMLRDRVRITHEHIAYFSKTNPSHVTLHISERIHSLFTNAFPAWFLILTAIGGMASAITIIKKRLPAEFALFLVTGSALTVIVLSYTVFDEIRYYLPVVPFAVAIAGYTLSLLPGKRLR